MIALTVIAIVKLVDIPQKKKHVMLLRRPRSMTGFRPNLSDALPQGTAVTLWATEKTEPVKPAHFATSCLGTPKLLIISGR